jgi:hypothetical protein
MNFSRLGSSPLTQSIFSRTDEEKKEQKSKNVIQNPENGNQKTESRIEIKYDKVTVRLPIEQNDWLDEFSRKTKRLHGSKISKEELVQLALEMLQYQNIDPAQVTSLDDVKSILKNKGLLSE